PAVAGLGALGAAAQVAPQLLDHLAQLLNLPLQVLHPPLDRRATAASLPRGEFGQPAAAGPAAAATEAAGGSGGGAATAGAAATAPLTDRAGPAPFQVEQLLFEQAHALHRLFGVGAGLLQLLADALEFLAVGRRPRLEVAVLDGPLAAR